MRAVDIIIKKRDQGELSSEEIDFFIQRFTAGEIPDYQASAWAMAVFLNGMSTRETKDLTLAMVRSGETLDLSSAVEITVDKHSSGGVGDKTTLVVEPMVAASGLAVGKMSGRGLGFSGGTLDKMESIPGFRIDLSTEEFLEQLRSHGLVLTGQTADLAPADGKLYALRDVTGTVNSIPLIASSIMSKKISGGADAIVLDVKVGLGAFMDDLEDARRLAGLMVEIGELAGRRVVALLSDMNQPLGRAVGNALEVKEAAAALQNRGPESLLEHCLDVAAQMLILGEITDDDREARSIARKTLEDGSAWEHFLELVSAQGGDAAYLRDLEKLPSAPVVETVTSPRPGFLERIHARMVGETAVELGAGREVKGQPIDHAVGIEILKEVGDQVEKGEDLFIVHARNHADFESARAKLLDAHGWSEDPVDPLPLVYDILR